MSGPFPRFWRQPIQYMRWAAHEKPAIYYSIWIGVLGPIGLALSVPIKKSYGWVQIPQIPMTYPGEL